MVSTNKELLNPWFSMWNQPRATIQQIVDRDPTYLVLLLAAITGFGQALDRASIRSAGDDLNLPVIFLIAAVAGPIGGIVGLYVGSALLRWTGSWIGGNASMSVIRTAMAWAGVPLVWALVLWIPELAIFGSELFTTATPRIDASVGLASLLISFGLLEISIAVWALVVFLKSLGQVQGFSAWKALGNGALALLVLVVPILLIAVGIGALTQPSAS